MSGRDGGTAPVRPAFTRFPQKFVRRNKEGILLKNAANDDHGMGSQDVNHRVTPELADVVSTDDGILVAAPHLVYARLEFNHVVYVRPAFDGPVHTTADTTQRKRSLAVGAGQLLERGYHAIGVETAIRQINVGVGAQLQLPALLRGGGVDSDGGQAL